MPPALSWEPLVPGTEPRQASLESSTSVLLAPATLTFGSVDLKPKRPCSALLLLSCLRRGARATTCLWCAACRFETRRFNDLALSLHCIVIVIVIFGFALWGHPFLGPPIVLARTLGPPIGVAPTGGATHRAGPNCGLFVVDEGNALGSHDVFHLTAASQHGLVWTTYTTYEKHNKKYSYVHDIYGARKIEY
jgi:hypothetical protein